ncbi:MAG: YciK family oxidoreductase [Gammaproteobacteria bacterium]|nr:YciK family oxidoreductase [Gammaproteobacteria bacterium]
MNTTSFDPRRLPLEADELAGRVVAITGPTSGIGRALALECARRGAEVLLLGRNVKKLELVYDEIVALRRADGTAVAEPLIAPLDLEKAVAGDYDAIASAIEQRWGRLDGLVHNAGLLGILSPLEHFDVPTWVKVMHVNVTAMFALTQVLLPALRASSDASVICTSSGVGRRGRAYWGAYSVSKFALEGFVQVLADELEKTTVRVNSIDPGRCRTPMRRQAYPSENPDTLPAPEAITSPFIALLGPQARGVSGRAFSAQ